MAQIDPSTIDGFDSMSAEEKVTALLGVEIPESVDLTTVSRRLKRIAPRVERAAVKLGLTSELSRNP